MYTVGVRNHIHVAHRLQGESFGPAQRLHGATYVVSAELEHEELDEHGVVHNSTQLNAGLKSVLDELNYKSLDEHPGFEPGNATPEHIARFIHRELGRKVTLRAGTLLTIRLDQSPDAWTKYRAPVRGGSSVSPDELGRA
jgi:6-pyruvoyltetrahydropterin/6-carboxytetrahydropterin synthase